MLFHFALYKFIQFLIVSACSFSSTNSKYYLKGIVPSVFVLFLEIDLSDTLKYTPSSQSCGQSITSYVLNKAFTALKTLSKGLLESLKGLGELLKRLGELPKGLEEVFKGLQEVFKGLREAFKGLREVSKVS